MKTLALPRNLRAWATPLTIGAFGLMAVSGTLMFFHLNTPLQESVHAWTGWLMVAGVLLHASANWAGFSRYFRSFGRAPMFVALATIVLAGSYAFAPRGQGAAPAPAIAIQALARAPLSQVAPLFGKTAEQARSELAAAGIALAGDDARIGDATAGNREQTGRALQVLAGGGQR